MTDAQRTPTGRIFISYRRQDSAYPAGWLYDRLAERFGPKQVFKDIDSIELGDDFIDVITDAVGSCDVLLALIGRKWLRISGPGRVRRLDEPNDFVRLEIEAALERKVMLIPILVDGATMPRSEELPPSISTLVRRHALELSPNRFRADTDHLLDVMQRTLADMQDESPPAESSSAAAPPEAPPDDRPAAEPRPERPRRSSRSRWVMAAGALAAAAAIAALVVGIMKAQTDDPRTPAGSPTKKATTSATTPPPLGGAGGPIVLAHRGGDETFAWQTLPAFEDAAKAGAVIETDVRWTKDGVAILAHDAGTTPGMECEGGSHVIADTTWPDLRDRCGSPAGASTNGKRYGIPTFSDAMSALSQIPGAQIFPEVKVVQNASQVRQFMAIVENVRMTDRTVITSSKPEELAKIRAQAEKDGVEIRLMQFVSGQRVPVGDLTDGLWGVAVEADVANEAYVKELQGAGLKVMIWNINTPEKWEEADRLGADLVMTDRPTAYGKWAKDR
ncbi:MAG: TIR domain-containing protein [Actinomycetota bacterium]|nr:TIR domain-containing protein [Actinomycetota bacterium]